MLFLPLSCFLVTKVEEEDKYNNYIYLEYLDKYKKKVEEKFQKVKYSNKDKLELKNAFLNDYGKYLYMLYNNIIDDYNKYLKNKTSLDIKSDIPDITKEYTNEVHKAIINFDTEEEPKKMLNEEKLNKNKDIIITNKVIYNVLESDVDEEGFVRILGENKQGDDFVKLNRDKITLEINGIKTNLCYKYKLNKGINEIVFYFKEKLEDFSYLFFEVTSLYDISALEGWDMRKAVNMNHIFAGCKQLSDISALRKWNTSSCRNFSCLFSNCISLKDISPLTDWKVGNGIFFSYLFYNCTSLKNLYGLGKWDVSQGKFFSCAFAYCSNLKEISPLENWNTSNGVFFSHLFFNCTSLTDITALENWNVSDGKFFDYLFYNCRELNDVTPLNKWDISKVKTFNYAFCGCNSLMDLNGLKKWSISSDCSLVYMFKGCNIIDETKPSWFYRTI